MFVPPECSQDPVGKPHICVCRGDEATVTVTAGCVASTGFPKAPQAELQGVVQQLQEGLQEPLQQLPGAQLNVSVPAKRALMLGRSATEHWGLHACGLRREHCFWSVSHEQVRSCAR